VDFSAFLILPLSAIVGFATLVGAAIARRAAPRLIWAWAFSTVAATLIFLRLPELSALGMWVFALFGLAYLAAFGTVIGGLAARAISSQRRG
jgi:hypothetical protein